MNETARKQLEHVREIARRCGYAVAVHGSEARDLDLIAVPWTEDATDALILVEELCSAVPLVVRREPPKGWPGQYHNPEPKPHGRLAWAMFGISGVEYLDLSVLPRR